MSEKRSFTNSCSRMVIQRYPISGCFFFSSEVTSTDWSTNQSVLLMENDIAELMSGIIPEKKLRYDIYNPDIRVDDGSVVCLLKIPRIQ